MALLIVCRFVTSVPWRASDLDISSETDEYDDDQRKPQSLESFMRAVLRRLYHYSALSLFNPPWHLAQGAERNANIRVVDTKR